MGVRAAAVGLLAVVCLTAPSARAQLPLVALPWPVQVKQLELRLRAQGPQHDELPLDGVSECVVEATVEWADPIPLGWDSNAVGFQSPSGHLSFDPPYVDVPLAPGRHTVRATCRPVLGPGSKGTTTPVQVATALQTDEATLRLREVQLEVIKQHADDLYSGTATGRACCDVIVRVWCPEAPHLEPRGSIGASVCGGPSGEGVFLRTHPGSTPEWARNQEAPLQRMERADGEEFVGARFAVAADCPTCLPEWPEEAFADFRLNGNDPYASAHTSFNVLVPRKLVLTWVGEERVAHMRSYFRGTIAWYADEECTKPYPGAKGIMRWSLPQGEEEREFHLSTRSGRPLEFHSPHLTTDGLGTLHLATEQGWCTTLTVAVLKPRQQRLPAELQHWLHHP